MVHGGKVGLTILAKCHVYSFMYYLLRKVLNDLQSLVTTLEARLVVNFEIK